MNLITVMISLAIGATIIAGGYDLFANVQSQQLKMERHIDIANAIQQARIILSHSTRNAVVSLCGKNFNWQGIENHATEYADRTSLIPVQHLQAGAGLITLWGLNKPGGGKIITLSPVLVTRTVTQQYWLRQNIPTKTNILKVPRSLGFKKHQFLTLQDCQHMVIDKIIAVSKSHGQDKVRLQHKLGLLTLKVLW